MANEYEVILFGCGKGRRLSGTAHVFFEVNPEIRFLRVEFIDEISGKSRGEKWGEINEAVFVESLKDWLFRRTDDPFNKGSPFLGPFSFWSFKQGDFAPEDKERIKFHWFQSEV
jgi:hypothetical protein